MTGSVVCFPGIDPALVRPAPTCFEELRPGDRAIVVSRDDATFIVTVRPIETDADAARRREFPSLRMAMQFARRIRACRPSAFPLILNETGRQTIGELMPHTDSDPMGIWEQRR